MKIHHLNPTFDGLRVVNSDMLVFHIEQGIILIYIGDLDNMEYDAHVQSNAAPNNMVVECLRSIIEESFCDTHEKGISPLDKEEYSNVTNDEYVEYMGFNHSCKILEMECVSDDECLETACDSDVEHLPNEFSEFAEDKHMYNPNLEVDLKELPMGDRARQKDTCDGPNALLRGSLKSASLLPKCTELGTKQ
ncbi:hypothetical protein M9H77_23131 [Catharanthus roseus]|uniref:Uncharacterized protein n=1 Tax=Catharanthus roseus TaxID=4058 RepID=A0ACC0AS61_CATRO|nr:hypothetical protein M9H77_23131 [Catharanthus roseus]